MYQNKRLFLLYIYNFILHLVSYIFMLDSNLLSFYKRNYPNFKMKDILLVKANRKVKNRVIIQNI